ncbi:MAG: YkgJ family cysteine cluster protein [Sedimentisphaerales bacterium]
MGERTEFLRRVGFRRSIIEDMNTYDCIFLRENGKGKACSIYPVRPGQCRTWPFWSCNLASPDGWNTTGHKCPGINRGRQYSPEQIQAVKNSPPWWRKDTESHGLEH